MKRYPYARRLASRALLAGTAGATLLVGAAMPAAGAVPGLVRVAAVSANNSNDFHSATATCPAGKRLTGTGFQLNGATGEANVDDFRPNGGVAAGPTSLVTGAYEEDSFALTWTVTTYGICANPLPGLVRVSATGPTNSNDFHSTTATCPAGKQLTGAGYEIVGATGEAVVDDFQPNGGIGTAPTSVTVGAYESDAFAGTWTLIAYAICANPVPGLVRVMAVSANNSNDFHSATATCPAGKVLLGTGFVMNGVTGDGIVDDLQPNGGVATAPTSVFVGAYEADGFAGNWTVTAYGICATA